LNGVKAHVSRFESEVDKQLMPMIRPSFLSFLPSLSDLLIATGFYSLLVIQLPTFANDPGVGWHLKTGQFIASSGAIPTVDPFLHSHIVRPWISDQWLSDFILYSLYDLGSWPLLYAFLTVIFASTFFIILFSRSKKLGTSSFSTIIAVLLAFKIAQIHFILRPVVFGFFFFALAATGILKLNRQYLNGESPNGVGRFFIQYAVLSAIWANCHGSFVFAPLLVGLFLTAIVVDCVLDGERPGTRSWVRTSFLLVLVSFVATLVNPYGYRLHESVISLGQSKYFMALHDEWRSPSFLEFEGVLFEVIVVILLVAAYLKGRAFSCFECLGLIVFAHFGLQSVRMLPYFAIFSVLPLARSLALIGGYFCGRLESFERLRLLLLKLEGFGLRGVGTAVFLVLAIFGSVALFGNLPLFSGPYGPGEEKYPYRAVAFLNERTSHKGPHVVVAGPEWGGFLTWFGNGVLRPVIDDRNTLLGEAFYMRFYDTLRPNGAWKEYVRELGGDYLLLHAESPLTYSIRASDGAPLLYEDERAAVFDLRGKESSQ
jgi:hypothetical protein